MRFMLRSGEDGSATAPMEFRGERWPTATGCRRRGDMQSGIAAGVGGGPVSRTPPRSGAACSEWCIAALSARWTRTDAVNVLTTNLEPDNVERFVREQVAMG
jgi:hypothetical protein